jgi:hypothetical protein
MGNAVRGALESMGRNPGMEKKAYSMDDYGYGNYGVSGSLRAFNHLYSFLRKSV